MPESPRVTVSVVYCEPGRVFDVEMDLPAGATVGDAIDASRVREARPEVDIRADRIGIFSRRTTLDAILRDGDRVEIYRSLKMDPKEARRQRAAHARPRTSS